LSAALIFWGEHNLRRHLLYGYKKKPGASWVIFLGVILVVFYLIIYIFSILNLHAYDIVLSLIFWGAWIGQARLSRRWNVRGEQLRQIVRPGIDLNELIEQEAKASE